MSLIDELRRLTAHEDGALASARARAEQVTTPPPPEVGALLRWAARPASAKGVAEIGSAGGVSALWTLAGLERGLVTSIEPDPHLHALAISAYEEAGLSDRVRSILGEPAAVLPRLSDGGYDLVLVQTGPEGLHDLLGHAVRLLREGGTLLVRRVLAAGDVPLAVTELLDDGQVTAALLPLDEGLLLATRTN